MAASALTVYDTDSDTLQFPEDNDVAANVDGNYFTWGAKTVMFAKNASGGDLTVKVDNAVACSQSSTAADHDETLTVSAGKWGLIDTTAERYRNASDSNRVNVTYPAGVTSLTVSAIRFTGGKAS